MDYPLERRCVDLLKVILYANGPVRVSAVTEQFGISRRSAYYDLEKIDDWLSAHALPKLLRDRAKGISVTSGQAYRIQQILFHDGENPLRLFTPIERERLIICGIILSSRPVFTEDFMEWCVVSRNTAVNDLKNLGVHLKKDNLTLRYVVKEGYRIQGDPVRARALFCLYYPQFMAYFTETIFSPEQRAVVDEYHLRLKRVETALQTEYISGILPTLAALVSSLVHQQDQGSAPPSAGRRRRSERFSFSATDQEIITRTKEYRLVSEAFPELEPQEQIYLALHLLGSHLQVQPLFLEDDTQAADIARKLAYSFEEITGVSCIDRPEFLDALAAHMKTSLYRYRYGIQIGNPMLDHIQSQYKEIFDLTKAAFLRISDETGLHISDSEIAYLALHFGGILTPLSSQERSFRILVVCPNGVGASNLIRQEVRLLVPQASDVEICPLSRFSSDENFDVLISTVPIPGEKNLIQVNPILTDMDKIAILRRCLGSGPAAQGRADDILRIAKKYVPEEALPAFSQDIQNYFMGLASAELPKSNYGSGLMQVLLPSHIQFLSRSVDWEEAIRWSCRPLLLDDSITEHYVEAIVAAQRDRQQYMILTDGLVLAHAQPRDGVKKIDAAMTICREPVTLGNGRPVRVFLALSAEDQTRHIQILNDVLALFSDLQTIPDLCGTKTVLEVLDYLQKKLEKE